MKEERQSFGYRKLSVGLASVALTAAVSAAAAQVQAEDFAPQSSAQEALVQAEQVTPTQGAVQSPEQTQAIQAPSDSLAYVSAPDLASAPTATTEPTLEEVSQQWPSEQVVESEGAVESEQASVAATLASNQSVPVQRRSSAATVRYSNTFVDDGQGNWYYLDQNGNNVTGQQTIEGKDYYFAADGKQVKGQEVTLDNKVYYYDENSGEKWVNRFHMGADDKTWYYHGADGAKVYGVQTIDGQSLYFDPKTGKQAKGSFVTVDGILYYYEEDKGLMLKNTSRVIDGLDYQFNANGQATAKDKVTVVNTSMVIHSFEFGPNITKIVLQFDRQVTPEVIHAGAKVTTAGVERQVTNSYVSDARGNVVYLSDSHYVTLELAVSYDAASGSNHASPFSFDLSKWQNKWVSDYWITVDGLQVKAQGTDHLQGVHSNQNAINNRILPDVDRFNERGSLGRYNFAAYAPTSLRSGEKNPLIIWLHGVGEAGTDMTIPLLANDVEQLTKSPIQDYFSSTGTGAQRGAYVLALQSPAQWTPNDTASLMYAIQTYVNSHPDIDSNRIYLAGLSSGGGMVAEMGIAYPNYFAALVPVSAPFDSHLSQDKTSIDSRALEALYNQPMWLVQTRADNTVLSDNNALPFYKDILQAGASNKWLSYFETNKGSYVPAATYDGHWSWVHLLNNQVTGVQNPENAKNWDQFYGMIATDSTGGGDAKASLNGRVYSNLFEWLNAQDKSNRV